MIRVFDAENAASGLCAARLSVRAPRVCGVMDCAKIVAVAENTAKTREEFSEGSSAGLGESVPPDGNAPPPLAR